MPKFSAKPTTQQKMLSCRPPKSSLGEKMNPVHSPVSKKMPVSGSTLVSDGWAGLENTATSKSSMIKHIDLSG